MMRTWLGLLFLSLSLWLNQALADAGLPGPLVDTGWLAEHVGQVKVLDVRKDVQSFSRTPLYRQDKKTGRKRLVRLGGHVPGAVLVDYGKIRANRVVNGLKLKGMLPEKKDFEKLMQAVGVDGDSAIVIVSKGEGSGDVTMATRLYWQLKYYGHDNMAILDGGLKQWLLDGHPVEVAARRTTPGNWRATAERRAILATSQDVARAVEKKDAVLVDNRPISLYLGTWRKSYVHAKGHIPGARPFPNELMTTVGSGARFLPAAELAQLARTLGIDHQGKVITYCNSGHLASGGWFILSELLGNGQASLYDGSMNQWTLEKRPVRRLVME